MRSPVGLVLLLGGVACGTSPLPEPAPPPQYRIAPRAPWAGGEVRVTSAAFRGHPGGAELRLGLTTFPLERADDTTFTLTIPTTAGGVYDPVLVIGDSLLLLDQLTISGFLDRRDYVQRFIYAIAPRTVGSHAGIMGGTLDRGFLVIDLEAFGVATTISGALDFTLQHGPGPTPDPDVVLLRPIGGTVESWRVTGIPARVAQHPELHAARGLVARLGNESWLVSFPDRLERWTRTDANDPFTIRATPGTGTTAVRFAPDGDLVAVLMEQVGATEPGVPVYRPPGGDVAFHVPLHSVQGVDWSSDGRTLAVAGGPVPGASQGTVLLIDAATGVVQRLANTDHPVFAVAVDPQRPFVYVGVATGSNHPAVVVLDRATLVPVGEMVTLGSHPPCANQGCRNGLLLVAGDRLFAATPSLNAPMRAYRFLLPATSGNP